MKYGQIIDADSFKDAGVDIPPQSSLANAAYKAMGGTGGSGNPDEECIKRVNGMKEEYGDGISTLITIYNASGLPLKLVDTCYDAHGHLFKYSPDRDIYNGEWSCFLHVKSQGAMTGSGGAIQYKLVGSEGVYKEDISFFVGWNNPYVGSATAYARFDNSITRTRSGFYDACTGKAAHDSFAYGDLKSSWSVGPDSSPILRAIAYL